MTFELNSSQRRAMRARAHSLHPVASISQNGLSEAVLAEIDRGLKAHELIKVRVYGVERSDREALLAEICARLEAAPVQHIGNILVIYRQHVDADGQRTEPVLAPQSASSKKKALPPISKRLPKQPPQAAAKLPTRRRRKA